MRLTRTLFQTVALSFVVSAVSLGATTQAASKITITAGGHWSQDGVIPEDGLKTVFAVLCEFVKPIK